MDMIIHQYSNSQTFSCNAILSSISELKAALSDIEVKQDVSGGGMTKKLIGAISPYLESADWKPSWPIDRTVPHNAYASYFIDYSKDQDLDSCGHYHRYFLQFMFDNRQAIGTNLMKFEIASRNSIINGRVPVCIAVCGEEGRIRKMGWDGSAASSQEYLEAINGPYASVLSNTPLILSIDNLHNV